VMGMFLIAKLADARMSPAFCVAGQEQRDFIRGLKRECIPQNSGLGIPYSRSSLTLACHPLFRFKQVKKILL